MRGSIHPRTLADGSTRYDVRYREKGPDKKQHTATFKTEAEAEKFCAATVDAVESGTYQRVTPAPLADVFTKWLAVIKTAQLMGNLRKSTRAAYASAITGHLLPAFGHLRSDEISTRHLDDWQTACAEKIAEGEIAAKSYNNHVGALSAALGWARTRGYLAHHPLPKGLRSKRKGVPRTIIEGAQLANLWRAATGQDQVIIALGLFAGLRRGEIFGMRWCDVTWPDRRLLGTLSVTQAFVQREIVEPKTAAGRRAVELPPELVAVLKAHEKARPPVEGPDGSAYIIRQDSGAPVDPDNWATRVWPVIRAAAKIPEAVTMHSLRHTFASLLLADGADIKHVSEQMGHTSIAFTMATYQHLIRRRKAETTRTLGRHIPTGRAARPLRLVKGA